MTVNQIDLGGTESWPVIHLSGEIDMSNAEVLADRVLGVVSNRASGLVLDLSDVTYLDSAGLHMVFGVARCLTARQQSLRLVVPPSSRIARLIDIAGVASVAEVVDERDRARHEGPR